MAKARRLQQEVEATLKRVQEGCDEWDALWDKLEDTEDPSQRDKIIAELKRDLKKLQRLRETVRGWAAGGEVKDEVALGDARRNIEREMERFKMLEKEIKTKAFSSEGLKRDLTDPVAMAKYACSDWLNEVASKLAVQTEELEADLEALAPQQGGPKGGKGAGKSPRALELAGWIARHKEHVARLEQVLRLLENDQVTPEEVLSSLKEGLEYYLDSYSDPDFVEDESLYDSLPLGEVDETVGKITAHTPRTARHRSSGALDAFQEDGEGAEVEPKGGKGAGRGKGSKAAAGGAAAGKARGAAKGLTLGQNLPLAPAAAAAEAGNHKPAGAKGAAAAAAPALAPAASSAGAAAAPAPARLGSFKAVAAGAAGKPSSPKQKGTPAPATPPTAQDAGAPAAAAAGAAKAGMPALPAVRAHPPPPPPPPHPPAAQETLPPPRSPAARGPSQPLIDLDTQAPPLPGVTTVTAAGSGPAPASPIAYYTAGSSTGASPFGGAGVRLEGAASAGAAGAGFGGNILAQPHLPALHIPPHHPQELGSPRAGAAAAAGGRGMGQQGGLFEGAGLAAAAGQEGDAWLEGALAAGLAGLATPLGLPSPQAFSLLHTPMGGIPPSASPFLPSCTPPAAAAAALAAAGYGGALLPSMAGTGAGAGAGAGVGGGAGVYPSASPFATPGAQLGRVGEPFSPTRRGMMEGSESGFLHGAPSAAGSLPSTPHSNHSPHSLAAGTAAGAGGGGSDAGGSSHGRGRVAGIVPQVLSFNSLPPGESPSSASAAAAAQREAHAQALAQAQSLSQAQAQSLSQAQCQRQGQGQGGLGVFGEGGEGGEGAGEGGGEAAAMSRAMTQAMTQAMTHHPVYQMPRVPGPWEALLLEEAVQTRPQRMDVDWRNPDGSPADPEAPPPPRALRPVVAPPSYPTEVHPSLRQEATFKKLSPETDFFAFYFQQGTRQQLFAANALKAQGWRYHTQFNAWFARQSQPKVVTDTYEQGSLIYFDCQLHNITPNTPGAAARPVFSGWCPRVSRSDFIFDYKHMENEDTSAPSG